MTVGKVWLIGENLLKRRDGRLKLLFVDIAPCLVVQIVERIGKFFRFRLARRLHLRARLSFGRAKRFPVKRALVLAAASQGVRRSHEETYKRGTEKLECGISGESRERHGSAEPVFFPVAVVAEPPLGLDAPFGGRFARPLGA